MSRKPILNPRTGTPYFGLVPQAKSRGVVIPSAPIILRLGKQSARGGYGAKHIWARHREEMLQLGLKGFDDVPRFVGQIILPGTPVHFEGMTRQTKVTVVRSSAGLAILQYDDADDVYSVTTAFAARAAHGVRIGQILEYLEPKAEPSLEPEKAKRPQDEPEGV